MGRRFLSARYQVRFLTVAPKPVSAGRKKVMRQLFLIAAATLLVGFASCARAEGAERAKKPMVCMSYSIAKTDKATDDAVAICYDGKKPALFYRFEEKEIPGQESGRVKVLVGWR